MQVTALPTTSVIIGFMTSLPLRIGFLRCSNALQMNEACRRGC